MDTALLILFDSTSLGDSVQCRLRPRFLEYSTDRRTQVQRLSKVSNVSAAN